MTDNEKAAVMGGWDQRAATGKCFTGPATGRTCERERSGCSVQHEAPDMSRPENYMPALSKYVKEVGSVPPEVVRALTDAVLFNDGGHVALCLVEAYEARSRGAR